MLVIWVVIEPDEIYNSDTCRTGPSSVIANVANSFSEETLLLFPDKSRKARMTRLYKYMQLRDLMPQMISQPDVVTHTCVPRFRSINGYDARLRPDSTISNFKNVFEYSTTVLLWLRRVLRLDTFLAPYAE